jgi:hypothetical protein
MKQLTKKQRQWLWFVGLWCGSLSAVLLLAYVLRLMMGLN